MAELKSLFTASIKTGVAPLTVNFTNTSTGEFTTVEWDFGDGNLATTFHASHQYQSDGVFQVSLKIKTIDGASNSSSQSITVFADNTVEDSSSSQQFGLFTTKRFEPGQVQVVRQVVTGSSYETQFPLSSSTELNYSLDSSGNDTGIFFTQFLTSGMSTASYQGKTWTGMSTVDGSSGFTTWWQTYSGGIDYSKCIVGIPLLSTATTLTLSGNQSQHYFNTWYTPNSSGTPVFLMYNPTGITQTGEIFTFDFDKCLPYRGEQNQSVLPAWIILNSSSGSTQNYFGNNFDNPANNWLKIKFGADQLREQIFDSSGVFSENASANGVIGKAIGTPTNTLGQLKAIIYPSGSELSTAEALYPGTQYISLPTIMFHDSRETGLKLYDYYGSTMLDPVSGQRYRHLRNGTLSTSTIVGRIFYDLKIAIIDDPDINQALEASAYGSFTLPPPVISQTETSGGWVKTGITYFVTYDYNISANSALADINTFGEGAWYGRYPCANYAIFTPTVNNAKIRLYAPNAYWEVDDASQDYGIARNSNGGIVYIATGSNETTLTLSSWKSSGIDYLSRTFSAGTELDQTYTGDMSTIVWGQAATTLVNKGISEYTPGDQEFIFGYMSGTFESSIYKLGATCVAKNNEFNSSQNPTHIEGNSVYITEVGAYNENNELLMYGKLNRPLEKNDQKYIVVKLELDL